ncbi:MAG: isopeptide-forming domain-containing fimbrial protein, partial [Sphingomonadales bacterium]|nr:isopeptide-forming domain-containing fimbrial protein [Sphingomonadales bacterium]
TPVTGATVTLVDAATGAPARVFADDGVTAWPSTVISGQPITDGAGNVYVMAPGEYRFPLAALGSYRIVVTPPAPYTAPSTATASQLSGLTRPDGHPLQIIPASYGQALALTSPAAVRVDIPVDRPSLAVGITKTASRQTAVPGDAVLYTITVTNTDPTRTKRSVVVTDMPSQWLRIRNDSVRIDGQPAPHAVTFTADGRTMAIALGDIRGGATRTVTYAATIRADAPQGQAVNRAEAVDSRGNRVVASVAVKVERDVIAGRMTLIGRIVDGGCATGQPQRGIPGVRVMLEDGSFAITDADGRYHFEGLIPGSHVVQAIAQTLPAGGKFTDCMRSTRNAGSASSRFVMGQGGSLIIADFTADLPAEPEKVGLPTGPEVASDRAAAGGETDWLAIGDGPTDFLFPAVDHNPRAPAVRVVIRHRKGQKVDLLADGKPVDTMAFDGTQNAPQGYAVSIWRGIGLTRETTRLTATVRDADGKIAAELTRDVHFSATPARFEIVEQRSRLTADGSTRPVVAVRILDRLGRPVHAGLTGGFTINAPYESAAQLDALQARQLSGLDRAAPTWTVKGDDGIALIELAPTMVSGALRMDFSFADGPITRRQTLEAWIVPGDQKWTLVGLAEGTIGSRSVADNMERGANFDSDLGSDARVAFYVKGRVRGKYLLTLSYDSAKQKDDQRLLGTIDPNAYYTVFADGSERRFDAVSREKLYVRIEGRTFYALYGDFSTDFDKTVLASYARNLTGVKGEGTLGQLRLQGFAARSGEAHRRDEIQGGGISGPYRLSSRTMVPNSETVSIEVRDRFRSELVIEKRTLVRFVDYDIDLLSGTISFKEPVLSRDTLLNPRFIVVDYDVERAVDGEINAGLRAEFETKNGAVRIGATVITDTSGPTAERANLAAVDVRTRLGGGTELRSEAAISRTAGKSDEAWLIELEHHDGKLDLLTYIRSAAADFGLGQMNGAERGRRKIGIDGRYRFSEAFSLNLSAWHDDSLADDARRQAVELAGTYRTGNTEARLGIAAFRDRLRDGSMANSTVVEGAVTRRFLDNRLEVTGAAKLALGKSESIDLPSRYQLGLRYALTPSIKLTAQYELAEGDAIRARTARAGVEVSPWDGARILSGLGQQDIAEYGKRSFATFGMTQSLPVTKNLTVDATLDSARTLGGVDTAKLVNPAHPASSGGLIGENGTLTEDFTAVTAGATWRHNLWTATVRGEYRDGELANRTGATFGVIRQLDNGSAIGAGFTWTRAAANDGASTEVFDGAISAAFRPDRSKFAALYKIEYRSDAVHGAVAGETGPAGRTALIVNGDAVARRLIGSVSINWSPNGRDGGQRVQRSEVGLFGAVRHNFDQYDNFDLTGTTLIGGVDLRVGIGSRFEIGGVTTVRYSPTDGTTSFAIGPQIGISPVDNVLLTVGYNVTGFRDRDFAASRNTNRGLFAAVRIKFDDDLLSSLGIRQ